VLTFILHNSGSGLKVITFHTCANDAKQCYAQQRMYKHVLFHRFDLTIMLNILNHELCLVTST